MHRTDLQISLRNGCCHTWPGRSQELWGGRQAVGLTFIGL